MNVLKFETKYDKPIVLALGFFDCLHIGHKSLLDEAKLIAKEKGYESAILTFDNDINITFGTKERQIYTIKERIEAAQNYGMDNMIVATMDPLFASLPGNIFLDRLARTFNIKTIIVGKDYRCGRNAEFGVDEMKKVLQEKHISFKVMPFVTKNGSKVASTKIKTFIKKGEMELVNNLLTENYFIVGKVDHDEGRGKFLGFPTANIPFEEDRLKLSEGVYLTSVIINKNRYYSITNVGKKPTFGNNNYTIETNLLNFSGDLYGKDIKLIFYKKIRNIIKFKNVPDLQKQIEKDRQEAITYFNL